MDERIELEGTARPAPDLPPTTEQERRTRVTVRLRRARPLPAVAMDDTRLPAERGHVSVQQLGETHGAATEDLSALEDFAREHGLTLEDVDRGAATAHVSGSIADLAKAFGTDLRLHHSPQGPVLAHRDPVTLPKAIADRVQGALGLDERARLVGPHGPVPQDEATASRVPEDVPSPRTHSLPDLARLYDFPEATGAGQCIGVIGQGGGFRDSDMKAYFESLGRPVPRFVVEGSRAATDDFSTFEATQNLQIVGALCPDATIGFYNPAPTRSAVQTYYNALAAAIHDREHCPSVVSCSYLLPEQPGEGHSLSKSDVELINDLLAEAASLGITICVAVGNAGGLAGNFYSTYLNANFPATSPWALACGGTSLYAQGDQREREVVWNGLRQTLDAHFHQQIMRVAMAGGGGVSVFNALPDYQQGADVPAPVTVAWRDGAITQVQQHPGRGIPDVAANADYDTGYAVYYGQPAVGMGTSCATPLWASLIGLVNEGLTRAHGKPTRAGFINPKLYELVLKDRAEVLRPVQGDNGVYATRADNPWSACAGLGVPIGTKLAEALGATY